MITTRPGENGDPALGALGEVCNKDRLCGIDVCMY